MQPVSFQDLILLAEDVLNQMRKRGLSLATAESCTGGLVSAFLTSVPGSSDVLDRGFVTYSNAAKIEMLGVGNASLTREGAVSETVAGEMAAGALDRSEADIAVAVTGVAGPGGSESKPEGRVCFAIAGRGTTRIRQHDFGAIGRDRVRFESVDTALRLILVLLQETDDELRPDEEIA